MGTTDPPHLESAKLYVIEDLGQCPNCTSGSTGRFTNIGQAPTEVGMDGAWVGANQGSSYFFFAAAPGEHHLCIHGQSRLPDYRARASRSLKEVWTPSK
jgi:hypothetical protein